jgi:hypothetical protein
MGEPILKGSDVPTTLPANEEGQVLKAPMEVAGDSWTVTAVSMGNPHAVVYSRNGSDVVVRLHVYLCAAVKAAIMMIMLSCYHASQPCMSLRPKKTPIRGPGHKHPLTYTERFVKRAMTLALGEGAAPGTEWQHARGLRCS